MFGDFRAALRDTKVSFKIQNWTSGVSYEVIIDVFENAHISFSC